MRSSSGSQQKPSYFNVPLSPVPWHRFARPVREFSTSVTDAVATPADSAEEIKFFLSPSTRVRVNWASKGSSPVVAWAEWTGSSRLAVSAAAAAGSRRRRMRSNTCFMARS